MPEFEDDGQMEDIKIKKKGPVLKKLNNLEEETDITN